MNPIDRRVRDNNIMLAMFLGLKPDDDQDRPGKPWWFYTGCSYMIFADEKDLDFNRRLDRLAPVYKKILAFVKETEDTTIAEEEWYSNRMFQAAGEMDLAKLYSLSVEALELSLDHFSNWEDDQQLELKELLPPMFLFELQKFNDYSGKKVGDIYVDPDTNMAWHIVEPSDKYALKLNNY